MKRRRTAHGANNPPKRQKVQKDLFLWQLPNEIIVDIVFYLDLKDIHSVCLVTKASKKIWTYVTKLHALPYKAAPWKLGYGALSKLLSVVSLSAIQSMSYWGLEYEIAEFLPIASMSGLTGLIILQPIQSGLLEYLTALTKLRNLHIVTKFGEELENFSQLQHIVSYDQKYSDYLHYLPHLTSLQLDSWPQKDASHIIAATQLRSLYIKHDINEDKIAELMQMTGLEHLTLQIPPPNFHVQCLTNLTSLGIRCLNEQIILPSHITSLTLYQLCSASVASLTSIQHLEICDLLTTEHLAQLEQLTNLRTLIYKEKIDNIEHISMLTQLTHLGFYWIDGALSQTNLQIFSSLTNLGLLEYSNGPRESPFLVAQNFPLLRTVIRYVERSMYDE